MDTPNSRRMWTLFEPIHDLTYFTPESRSAYEDAGLRGYWRGYFAGRAAPLGEVGAAPVIASFYSFAPSMIERAIPAVWSLASPAQALAARTAGAEAAMARILADVPAEHIAEATAIAETAVGLLEPAGRPLGAANAALPTEAGTSMLGRLWQTTATLREHRGDGHVAALLAYGFGGCEAAVWRTDPGEDEQMQGFRGWTPEQWTGVVERLVEQGWLEPSDTTGAVGKHTDAGNAAYTAVEAATDRAAARVWQDLGADATARLADLLSPMARTAFAVLPKDIPNKLPSPASA